MPRKIWSKFHYDLSSRDAVSSRCNAHRLISIGTYHYLGVVIVADSFTSNRILSCSEWPQSLARRNYIRMSGACFMFPSHLCLRCDLLCMLFLTLFLLHHTVPLFLNKPVIAFKFIAYCTTVCLSNSHLLLLCTPFLSQLLVCLDVFKRFILQTKHTISKTNNR